MKFKLSPAARDRLAASRAGVVKGLAQYKAASAGLGPLQAQLEELPASIERAVSKVDPADDDALLKIAKDKTRLVAVERQLGEMEARLERGDGDMRMLLNRAQRQVDTAIGPIRLEAETRILAHLIPLFGEGRARALLHEALPFQALAHFAKCNFTGMVDVAAATGEALRTLDLLLSGELPFITLPQSKAAPRKA